MVHVLQYDPVCAISISDAGAMPSEGYASDDATPTRTPTHSRLHSSGTHLESNMLTKSNGCSCSWCTSR